MVVPFMVTGVVMVMGVGDGIDGIDGWLCGVKLR
jgi:hypothetical protein